MAKASKGFESAGMLSGLLDSDNPFDYAAVKTQLPRLMGEVGNLNTAEQAAWGVSPDIVNQAQGLLQRYFSVDSDGNYKPTGSNITPADKEALKQILGVAVANKTNMLRKKRDVYVRGALPAVGRENLGFVEEMMPLPDYSDVVKRPTKPTAKTLDDYTDEELMNMSEEEFQKLEEAARK